MAKQQKQIIIIAVLVVVLLIAWVNVFTAMKKRVGKNLPVSNAVTIKPEIETAHSETGQSVYPAEANLEWIRCPFSGKFYTGYKSGSLDLKLEGILWDKEKPQAIIDNEVVSVGNSVSGYIVIEIRQYNVVLTDGISVFELKLDSLVK